MCAIGWILNHQHSRRGELFFGAASVLMIMGDRRKTEDWQIVYFDGKHKPLLDLF